MAKRYLSLLPNLNNRTDESSRIGLLRRARLSTLDDLRKLGMFPRFFPETTSENTSEVNIPEEMVTTIWELERLIAFKSKYARRKNGNIVADCINTAPYVSQINTYEVGGNN